jgi:hypothetical protein
MARISIVEASKRTANLLLCAVVFSPFASAQLVDSKLESTRMKLDMLQTCLGPGDNNLRILTKGLLVGWSSDGGPRLAWQGPPPPPPNDYLDSLDMDLKACMLASKIKDKGRKQSILDAVSMDIAIKAEDCRKFGMGRMVSVRVFTLRGAKPEDGWEVFYKWYCASDFQPAEMRAARLTNPAVLQLPPGSYSIRAQRKISDTQMLNTEPVRTAIGLQASVDIQLPIQ